jgi:hypothetical protein
LANELKREIFKEEIQMESKYIKYVHIL